MFHLRRFMPLIVLFLLVACAAPPPVAAPVGDEAAPAVDAAAAMPMNGGSIARALTTEPSGLDPHGPPGSGQNILLPYLFDTLVYRDAGNNYHPFLAESWEISPDGTEISFKLRQDVTFHDGTAMDAEAVVFTFERFIALGSTSPVAGGLLDITGIEAVDEHTVRFHFDAPSAIFFGTISMPYAGIISPTAVETYGEAFAQHPVGTGPFKLAEWQPGVAITLERNPDYAWGPLDVENKGAPYIDQAIFKVIPDASTQLAAFQAGEVDIIFLNQPAHLEQLRAAGTATLSEVGLNSLVYLGFNCQRPPFDDVRVRQALAHAVDKETILQLAAGGIGDVAFAPLASTLPGFAPDLKEQELGYDPEGAAALLAAAGFTRDGEPLRATLVTSTRAPNGDIATLLQAQFQAVGVELEIQQLDARAAMSTMGEGDYDLMLWRYGWNDADVLNIYLGSDRIGRTNRNFYSNPVVDDLFAQANSTLDGEARARLYHEAQQYILADAPWQPLYEPLDVLAVRAGAEDVVIGPMGRVLLNDAWVAKPVARR